MVSSSGSLASGCSLSSSASTKEGFQVWAAMLHARMIEGPLINVLALRAK